jgi:shikimate dehydrogenase
MHNAALREMKLDKDFHYEKKQIMKSELSTLVASIESGNLEGANITIPYKTSVIPFLSKLTKSAIMVGAVNTLYRQSGEVFGDNTDVKGFLQALIENGVNPKEKRVTIIGSGGAARAITYAMVNSGISKLEILNRSQLKADELASSIKQYSSVQPIIGSLPTRKETVIDTDILVNCTPIGMTGHSVGSSPIPKEALSCGTVVVDIVYNPIRTKLLEDADRVGCKIINGIEMLVHQGALSLELWTGCVPPIGVMREEVLKFLGGRSFES